MTQPNKKYKPKLCKELIKLRSEGKSINACCLTFGISRTLYYNWLEQHPKFKDAAELADTYYNALLEEEYDAVMLGKKKGNAGLLIFKTKQCLGWADKIESHTTHEEQVHCIQIEVLPKRKELLENNTVIDITNDD